MRIKNTSPYPTERVKELLRFAFRGIADAGVEVHVKGTTTKRYGGLAYGGIPHIANVAATTRYLITIRLPRNEDSLLPVMKAGTKRLRRLYPEGIPIENWEDLLVFIGAHEGRHIWQYQRRKRTGKRGKGEYDADKFAFKQLNAWRTATGREPVPPIKQPNPFT